VSQTRLVHAFIASATSEFARLVEAPGARWSLRVEHLTERGVVEVAPAQIAGFFFLTASFANRLVAGRLTFGDREYLVNTLLGPASTGVEYGLWEWADALGSPDLVPRDTAMVTTVDRLEVIVAAMADAVSELQAAISSASPAVVKRVEHARAMALAADEARHRTDDHRRLSAAAAEAFAAHDYGRAVQLLEGIGELLTPAEQQKLAYARRKADAS
jgi:hypothetical protein